MEAQSKIPKIIHYCWFGGKPLNEMALRCIDSWRKCCPDYEIIQWDEKNFDINGIPYAQQAYQAKKWAFVSDYARFKILYEQGGVYLDTDVELLKPLDELLKEGGFMASESDCCDVATGLGIAAPAGMPIYEEILRDYEESAFVRPDGSNDLTTVVKRITSILERHGLQRQNVMQHVAGITVYPKEYFCPYDYHTRKMNCTENTHAIHYFAGSWWTDRERMTFSVFRKLNRVLPHKTAMRCARAICLLRYEGIGAVINKVTSLLIKK